MFNTAFLAVLNSPMNDDPVGSEKILQDFYNGANRQKKEVNEATTFVLIFDVLVTFWLCSFQNFETVVSGEAQKLPQYTEKSDCQTPFYTTPTPPGGENVIKMSMWTMLACMLLILAA